MTKLLTKITRLVLGLSLAAGVGVAIGSKAAERVNAEDEVFYSMTPESTGSNSSPHNSYTAAATITIGGVGWSVTGNSNMTPWRIGGKSIASGADRDVHTTTALGSAITKVELTLGAASSCTVNSVTLNVGSSVNGSQIDTVAKTSGTLYNTVLTFEPTNGGSWATGSYYTFILNVSVSSSSNKFVEFSKVDFYREKSASSKYTVTYDLNGGSGTNDIPEDNTEYNGGATVTVLGIGDVTKTGYSFVNWSDGTNTYDEDDTFTITSNITLTAQWYHDDVISVVSGKESNEIYTGATLNLTTCVTAVGDGALSFTVGSVNYLTYDAETTTITADSTNTGGPLTITAHKGEQNCTFTVTVVSRPATGTFTLYTSSLVEGDYVVCSGNNAMKNTATSAPRIEAETVVVSDNSIENPSASVIWHIAPEGDYWTFYNEEESVYAAFTGSDGRGNVVDSITDHACFSVSGTFDFYGKVKTEKCLRYNAGYGFASYGTGTGATLTLYKLPEAEKTITSSRMVSGNVSASTGDTEWTLSDFKFFVTYEGESETEVTSQTTFTVAESVPAINASGTMDVTVTPTFKGVEYTEKAVTVSATLTYLPVAGLVPGTNGYSNSSETNATNWQNETQTNTVYLNGVTFTPSGGSNVGKYYTSDTTWRFYRNDTLTISVAAGYVINGITFNFTTAYNGTLVDPDDGNSSISSGTKWVPTTPDRSFAFAVTGSQVVSGNTKNGQIKYTGITVEYSETLNPVIVITPVEALDKDATGTFAYTTANATSISLAWASSDSSVVRIDNASTGAYTALAHGTATISVTLTCNEGSATDSISVEVGEGLITIARANEICAALASGATTSYKVTLSGYIVDLSVISGSGSNPNAITLADYKVGGSGNSIMIYGVYNSDALRNYAVLNGTVSYKGHLQNYNGTYELKDLELVSYTDDAIEFARTSYNSLTATCEAYGAAGITTSQWTALSEAWDDVDSYSKAKLQAATSDYAYSDDIAHWITRYTIIVQSGKADFMSLGISSARQTLPVLNENTNTIAIIVIISMVSVTAIGGYFFIKRRKVN